MGRHSAPGAGVSLLDHINVRLAEFDLRWSQRFADAERAVDVALLAARDAIREQKVATENRLALLNELRGGVATKDQFEAQTEKLDFIQARLDRMEGRSGGLNAGWGYLVGVVGVAAALLAIFAR